MTLQLISGNYPAFFSQWNRDAAHGYDALQHSFFRFVSKENEVQLRQSKYSKQGIIMGDKYAKQLSSLIDNVSSHAPKGANALEKRFIDGYFAKVPLTDLEKIEPKRAYAIAKASYGFFENRTHKNKPSVRFYKPSKSGHKWEHDGVVMEVLSHDMPFLVDSLTAMLSRLGFSIYETIHPVYRVSRTAKGDIKKMHETDADEGHNEAFIHFQLSALPSGLSQTNLRQDVLELLDTISYVVKDWKPIKEQAMQCAKSLTKLKHFDKAELEETKAFMHWLVDNNYVFLGYIDYDFKQDKKGALTITPNEDSALGLFRSPDYKGKPRGLETMPKEALRFALEPKLMQISKSTQKSIVHRPVLMDYIAIKKFNTDGKVIGERRFLGMFTSIVYYQSTDEIPYIRRKITQTLKRANFDTISHNGKQLKAILEFYPREELFQISLDDLFYFSIGIMSIEARPEVRLFVRKDEFERFMSCMVYVPRDRFSSYLREQIAAILENAFSGKVSAFYTQLSDSPLARVHMVVATKPCHIPDYDSAALEKQIAQVTNLWEDSLRRVLNEHHSEKESERLLRAYADAFPTAYTSRYKAIDALHDIAKAEEALKSDAIQVNVHSNGSDDANAVHLKVYSCGREIALSDMLPILENMGCRVLDANPYTISPKRKKKAVAMRDFHLIFNDMPGGVIDCKIRFEEAFLAICEEKMSNDPFNALVLHACLNWREVTIIRAYSQYLQQIGFPYSRHYVAEVMARHAEMTKILCDLFDARFNPVTSEKERESTATKLCDAFKTKLDAIANIAEDKIMGYFYHLINATLRTNAFQTNEDGEAKAYLSFKFDSGTIPGLPLPVPFREIFVYSLHTEGIHLRGGPVARGGLRWSDRPEDFRTEVLGLMKAQMVKNAVIVPQGSKGGFVVKRMPKTHDRNEIMQTGIESYKQFLSGLLDITDNIINNKIIPPKDVVRRDTDDPYLVVAADKGTATFSDIANEVAISYGFWLGDAFASGGSAGYDHKAMGITARGAWVSVQRHFRELGKDIQTQDFTVIGIGDMSGDVFGNGMLLSKHIRLVAAFNHRHIFIDPNPDAAKSYKERERLFKKPRSSWDDYNNGLISKGGAVFERTQKTIKLSKEVRKALDTDVKEASPDELIRIILKAPVELLWNGGIGTYIKASSESHDDVNDRSNNNVRVDANELRCNVVGEGGNLGLTQLGRIQYARRGGHINTDAIDNSAGVDCSDHEVNIKIALGSAVEKKKLSKKTRDQLLEKMTDEVADLVLIDNQLQTQALTVAEYQGYSLLEPLARMIKKLEEDGFLDRSVEFLPTEKIIADRQNAKRGFTRPELSVLLAYAKLALIRDLRDSAMLSSSHFEYDLLRYFPSDMRKQYVEEIHSHRLRREIIGTIITNSIINRAGIGFMFSMQEETGMHPCDIARAYIITRDAFGLRDYWNEIQALDGSVDVSVQSEMFVRINQFIEQMTLWFLRHGGEPIDMNLLMDMFANDIRTFSQHTDELISDTLRKAYDKDRSYFAQHGVPDELARKIARLEALLSAPDVVMVAQQFKRDVKEVAAIYFELGAQLRFGWLRRCTRQLPQDNYWDRLAARALIGDFFMQQRHHLIHIMETTSDQKEDPKSMIGDWVQSHERVMDRYMRFVTDLKHHEEIDLSMLTVALRQVSVLVPNT